ncbi:MAG: glycogen synthase [Acidobacteriota bacterium]
MSEPRVLMVAAENDALPGGKVGGIGDVVRDAPLALARRGWLVDVVTPSHGFLHRTPGAYWLGTVSVRFGGGLTSVDVHVAPGKCPRSSVTHLVIDHPGLLTLNDGQPSIYCDDAAAPPFAADASKYALFCTAVAECLRQELFSRPTALHLHDWHAALVLLLRKYDPEYASLQGIRAAYSIHNLALQGIRPFTGHPSALASWFPRMRPTPDMADPRWPDNINPMAVGIRLADAVHTVSPSYAAEILGPSDPPRAYGGEGLDVDLTAAHREHRLFGILNGCDYSDGRVAPRLALPVLASRLRTAVAKWIAARPVASSADIIALERLRALGERQDAPLLMTSVSRLVDQKASLLRASGPDGISGLHAVLDTIQDLGVYVFLGTGDSEYEAFFRETSARYENFVFLNGYSDEIAQALYGTGDLFVMPSSYEPCGMGQMLAMRDGQPCLVHAVGGLRDTVVDSKTGFLFHGQTIPAQVEGLRQACERAVLMWSSNGATWAGMRAQAEATRFSWDETVEAYVTKLYS